MPFAKCKNENLGVKMIKLKNPHSRKRLTLKEKFNKYITNIIVPYIKKLNWMRSGKQSQSTYLKY